MLIKYVMQCTSEIGWNTAEERTTKLSTKNLALTLLGGMLGPLYTQIFTTSRYPLEIQWGYMYMVCCLI